MSGVDAGRSGAERGAASRFRWMPAVLVAALVFHLLRTFVVERYRVTSRSMEPTLHGHPEGGDIVLVDRTAWMRGEPRCGDLVVVRNRSEPGRDHLVKRFLMAGPGWVRFVDGDVFVGEQAHLLERVVKDPRDRARRFVRWRFDRSAPPGSMLRADALRWSWSEGEALRVLPAGPRASSLGEPLALDAQEARLRGAPYDSWLPGHASTSEPVGTAFLDPAGRLDPSGGPSPRDLGMDVTLRLDAGVRALQFVFEYAEDQFALRLLRDPADGACTALLFVVRGESVVELSPASEGAGSLQALPADSALRFEFGYLDGRFFLLRDDALVFEHAVELPQESRLRLPRGGRKHDLLHLGVAGAPLWLERMEVFRDAHYQVDRPEPQHVEFGEIYVLGDNPFDSADSRENQGDPLRVEDLIGRPCAILGPRGSRWL